MVPPGELCRLARRPQARRRHPSRRHLRHHRDRRRPRARNQFPSVAAAARLVRDDAHAVHLCVVGRDLWRRRARLRRRLRRRPALDRLRPINLYGWSKHLFDLAVAERVAEAQRTAAAVGGAEVLQRVRPERVPQGRDDEPRRQALRRRQVGQADPAVQVAPRGHRRRRSAARLHLCRRRGGGGALASGQPDGVRHLQCRHRRGAQLPRPGDGDVSRARPRARRSNMSTCRRPFATATSISRKPRSRSSGAPATMAASRRSRMRCRDMSAGISTGPTVIGDVADRSFMHPIDQQLAKFSEMTVLCVGDLMLDHFVYGDVSRVSPEAPTLVIAVRRARSNWSAAPATSRATSPRSARAASSSASSARTKAAAHWRGNFADEYGDAIETHLLVDRLASDHPQGALRVGSPFDPSAAGGLGTGGAAAARHRAGADPGVPARAAARGCGGAVGLRQGRAEPAPSSARSSTRRASSASR